MITSNISLHPFEGADWQAALEALAGPGVSAFQQSAPYGDVMRALGRKVARVEIRSGTARIGLVQMIARSKLWLISRGPVFGPDVPQIVQQAALRRLARRVGVVIATPERAVGGFGLIPLISPRHHAIWSLSPAEPDLRAGLAGKWRNRLVAAERAGLRLRVERNIDWILHADQVQQAARGYRALPARFTQAWAKCAPDGLRAWRVEDRDGQRLAGLVVLRHGAGASYHIGWSGAQGRRVGAHNFGLWHAALWLRRKGGARFDLGDINSEDGAGRMHFKLGTGAQPHPLGATAWVVPN
ncbi:GNAT family N-acetyltransferase [Thioclava indica]|nr:GNAT family N-acetyltransferase [Thioclava indica]